MLKQIPKYSVNTYTPECICKSSVTHITIITNLCSEVISQFNVLFTFMFYFIFKSSCKKLSLLLILATPVDKSGMSPTALCLQVLMCGFVSVKEWWMKKQLIFLYYFSHDVKFSYLWICKINNSYMMRKSKYTWFSAGPPDYRAATLLRLWNSSSHSLQSTMKNELILWLIQPLEV